MNWRMICNVYEDRDNNYKGRLRIEMRDNYNIYRNKDNIMLECNKN